MVTLAVEISNCQGLCEGCHSPFLRQDTGEELSLAAIDSLIADNFGVNCFLFLGEGNDREALVAAAAHVRSKGLAVALYSGRKDVEGELWDLFDFVKVGPFITKYGPLNNPATNQRLYDLRGGGRKDITSRFWTKGLDPNRYVKNPLQS